MTDTLKPAELDLEALKPCPICGGKAMLDDAPDLSGDQQQIYGVRCVGECQCRIEPAWIRPRQAIDEWNRRAPDPRIEALEAERDEALRECSKWAREAGEAVGKLETSELAGIVDGWKARALSAEAQRDRMREALTLADRGLDLAMFRKEDGDEAATISRAVRAALSQGTAGSSGAGE